MKLPIVFLLAGMILATVPSALWAKGEVPEPNAFFNADPTAPGTKRFGPLGIFYKDVGNPFNRLPVGDKRIKNPATQEECVLAEVNMYFVLRLKGGVSLSGFGGSKETTLTDKLCLEDIFKQRLAIEAFITGTVIPLLFPDKPTAPWALKSVADFAPWGQPQLPPPNFVIMDIELAVRE